MGVRGPYLRLIHSSSGLLTARPAKSPGIEEETGGWSASAIGGSNAAYCSSASSLDSSSTAISCVSSGA